MKSTSFTQETRRTVLARHAAMVLDPHRTNPLKKAINKIVKRGDVVCDIGAGLGLLTFFALSAGAKHVYAIDCDAASLDVAIDFAKKHGVTDKITFIEGHSFDVELPERADVIICETIGSAAFDENILATLADAKKRFLKRGGRIIPESIELWGKSNLSNEVCLTRIKTKKHFGPRIHVRHNFIIKKAGKLSGIIVWPKVEWVKGFITDASPSKPLTHWKQALLPVKTKFVKAGDKIKLEIIIRPDQENLKNQSEILWKIK